MYGAAPTSPHVLKMGSMEWWMSTMDRRTGLARLTAIADAATVF